MEVNNNKLVQATYTSILILGVLVLAAVFSLLANNIPKYTLTEPQKLAIKSQMTKKEFYIMEKYHCDKVIAKYITTGEWSDTWCYNKYKNLELH